MKRIPRLGGWNGTPIHPLDKAAMDRSCYFDPDAALHAKEFIETYCYLAPGKPMALFDFQWLEIVAPLFGWKLADGTRRFRMAYIELPKKMARVRSRQPSHSIC
jgi:phage terminase large subunit-like protein